MKPCALCGGDGLKLVPVANTSRMPMGSGSRPTEIPSHFTVCIPCVCYRSTERPPCNWLRGCDDKANWEIRGVTLPGRHDDEVYLCDRHALMIREDVQIQGDEALVTFTLLRGHESACWQIATQ